MAQPDFTLRTATGELDDATVVRFTGSEAISGLYTFDVTVKIPDSVTIDLDAVLRTDATFTIAHDGKNHLRHGILSDFEMRHTAGGYSYYAARLVPRVWRLSLYPTNEVFVGPDFTTVDRIIDTVLSRAGFSSGMDFDISGLTATYPERSYTCQFGETDLAFISRLMERDGIRYHFEQGADAETLVMFDDANYAALDSDDVVFAVAPDDSNRYRSIQSWVCRKRRLPQEIVLRDYNYSQPSLDVSGTATVDPDGQGSAFIYGENFDTAEEGARLARVRAEELACRRTLFHGQGAVPAFTAGYTFTLTGHPAQGGAWNDQPYLLIAITHEGENLDNPVGSKKNAPRYGNTFTAIPADTQFRPERVTPKPRFDGTMTAMVYAENPSATLAEVNETGHYRVRLPFDRADEEGEKASHWIRMAQPYAGAEQGMYFPLKVNTEVLLTFINGDPDRPVIAGAVPNAANLSLLNSDTANQATIATPDLLKLQAAGGAHSNVATARYMNANGGGGIPPSEPPFGELDPATVMKVADMTTSDEVGGSFIIDRAYGDIYHYGEGNTYAWGNESTFNFGNDYEELHEGVNFVDDPDAAPASERYAVTHYTGDDCTDDPEKEIFVIPALGPERDKNEGLVEKNWGNKYEYHYGASFNWAGGIGPGNSHQEFNYGNGYVENLLEKTRGTFATEYADTRHNAWENESRIDPTKSAIEKTYGATYEYHNGFSYEVHEGDSRAETYGDSTETVSGDSTETVHGNSNGTVHGNSFEMIYGDVKGIVHGSTNDMVLGGVNDMHLGGKNEMTVAAINNMALSVENNLWLGLKTDIQVGGIFELTGGGKIELNLGATVEADSVADLRTKVTAIDSALTRLESLATDIKTSATDIKNGATSLNLSALKFW